MKMVALGLRCIYIWSRPLYATKIVVVFQIRFSDVIINNFSRNWPELAQMLAPHLKALYEEESPFLEILTSSTHAPKLNMTLTRKSCSETNLKAAVRYRQSAIMQHFNDNEKETIKNDSQSAILDFISGKFLKGYPCARPYIFFICMVQLFSFDFELRK